MDLYIDDLDLMDGVDPQNGSLGAAPVPVDHSGCAAPAMVKSAIKVVVRVRPTPDFAASAIKLHTDKKVRHESSGRLRSRDVARRSPLPPDAEVDPTDLKIGVPMCSHYSVYIHSSF